MMTDTKETQLGLVEPAVEEKISPLVMTEQERTNVLLAQILAAVERVIAQNEVALQNAVAAGSSFDERPRGGKEQVDILRYYSTKLEAQADLLALINQKRAQGDKELSCHEISQFFRKKKDIGDELYLKFSTIMADDFLRYAGLQKKTKHLFLI